LSPNETLIPVMTAAQVRAALTQLGHMWRLGRAAYPEEVAHELGLGGPDPGRMVERWVSGSSQPSGPCSRLLQALLAGYRPSELPEAPAASRRLPGPRSAG
jgi:hypothetical protein